MSRPHGTPHRLTPDEMRRRLRRLQSIETIVLGERERNSVWCKKYYYRKRLGMVA